MTFLLSAVCAIALMSCVIYKQGLLESAALQMAQWGSIVGAVGGTLRSAEGGVSGSAAARHYRDFPCRQNTPKLNLLAWACWGLSPSKIQEVTLMRPIHGNL